MPLFQLILLAVIQGITEFLPISSSGHLILLPQLTSMADQGQTIDVAVHVGTLGAVILYFWSDVKEALLGLPRLLRGKLDTPGARLAFLLIVATIPAILVGLVLKVTGLADMMRSALVIGVTMLVFGVVLWWADQKFPDTREAREWTLREAWILGLWQAVALIPGTSRSGITITGARFMGYARADAAKISMLMSVPVIIASGVLLGLDIATSDDAVVVKDAAIAAGFAFVSALLALVLMMRLLRSVSFTPYVIYRVVLGAGLILWSLS
ncbi:undecaprenyl-diphosphate phosphatase [Pseudooceanicola nitratireducens]|jgi:undecaprenyl-diphosphatase|uniref:Undecaprenyl-diphosphatase n=1 Tax=Pseudooceanicola nitratireducens TaxID=517719 RepID=A0A1I1HGY0_9RHOB|nr:undecaprenyl-diphosphate phosphatase [Pseudooceanicola nitratireducens]MEC8669514.1 undecaprenyl-diphosphate phosphatase [Pseudomonadota bacterium]SEJ11928.1 undecaprenyl-diphosphatase [Pseudooceanicola nitratireducens]SFC22965.1 undecaprenyl-diphosphatase [Pseudooceanicola nitratireducens]|eukprot:g14611.t1